MSTIPLDHPLHCKCGKCPRLAGPSLSQLEANYQYRFHDLVRRVRPIRDYYKKLLEWDGGCALPSDPSKGEQEDFVRAVEEFEKAAEERQKAKAR